MSTSKDALKTLVLKYNVPQCELEPLRLLDKRDTHMEPKYIIKVYDIKEAHCSICNSTLELPELLEINFCPYCGQRLQWSKK